jgi:hypothetical protein
MHSLDHAEWILSLVMRREQAAAVVGDLAESATGGASLWISVASAFFGSLFSRIFEARWEMACAAKDFLLTAAYLSARYALRFLFPVLIVYMAIWTWPLLAPLGAIAGLFGIMLKLAISLVAPWKTGRIVAERHPGKELPAFVVICAAALALSAASSLLGSPWTRILTEPPWVLLHQIPAPWNPVLMLISMILARRRWLRQEDPSALTQ